MTGWPIDWDQRLAEVGVTSGDATQYGDESERIRSLVQLSDDVFAKVNSFETSEEQYRAICEEFYPGGKIDKLTKEVSKIANAPFKQLTTHEDIPQDALLQIQRQIIEGDDAIHLESYSPRFVANLKASRALALACKMDPEIAQLFGPKSLGGSFGAKLFFLIENAPLKKTLESTADEIIRLKNTKGIGALKAQKAFIVKCPSEETQRCGIHPHQEVCREEWAYALQQLTNVDFGVPPTVCAWMPFDGSLQWCSVQEFVSGAAEFDGRSDAFYASIPQREFLKLVFDIFTLSTDRAFRNIMIDEENKIYLIDNGLTFPIPTDEGLREGQFQWMSLPQAAAPLEEGASTVTIQSLDIEKLVTALLLRTETIALRSKGWSKPIDKSTQDLLRFTVLLVQTGIELKVPLKNIAATMVPVRNVRMNKLLGGEAIAFMETIKGLREAGKDISWKTIRSGIKQVLTADMEDRQQHGRQVFLADWLETISEEQDII